MGTSLSLLKQDGDVCANATVCDGDACSNEWNSDNDICHTDSAKCVYDNGYSLEEFSNGFGYCNPDHSYYRTCSSGTWLAQTNNTYSSNSACIAQGDANGGYILASEATCASGTPASFAEGSCHDCTDNLRALTDYSGCYTDCSGSNDDAECIANHYCYSGDGACYTGVYDQSCDIADDECDGTLVCSSSNLCKKGPGDICSADEECASNTCNTTCLQLCDASTPCGQDCTYDGDTYRTVQVGSQCWFRDDLTAGTFLAHGGFTNNDVVEYTCYYPNSYSETRCYQYNMSTYEYNGSFYSWWEAMGWDLTEGAQGACPVGWHIPTETEFNTLITSTPADSASWLAEDTLISSDYGGWNNSNISNIELSPYFGGSGFDAKPIGYYETYSSGNRYSQKNAAYYWSSTLVGENPKVMALFYSLTDAVIQNPFPVYSYGNPHVGYGLSVRCIKD
mgnify:CR=1 FL=1